MSEWKKTRNDDGSYTIYSLKNIGKVYFEDDDDVDTMLTYVNILNLINPCYINMFRKVIDRYGIRLVVKSIEYFLENEEDDEVYE